MSLQLVSEEAGEIIDNSQNVDNLKPVSYRKMSQEERDALKARVESVKKDFEEHEYKFNVTPSQFHLYKDFLQDDAEFDGKDCLGIPKVFDALNECEKEASKVVVGGNPQYMLTNMHLEALYYYLTKKKGKGYAEAKHLKELLDPVIESLSRAVVRRNTLQAFLEKAEAQLHGIIDPDEVLDPEYENEEEDGTN